MAGRRSAEYHDVMSLRLQVQEGDCRALRHGERRMPGARVCHCCGPARRVQAHMRAGPMAQVSATCWSSKLSTPRSHRRCSVKQNCTLLYAGRSCAQRARSARYVSPLACGCDCLPASPLCTYYSQAGPPVSATRPSLDCSRAPCLPACVRWR